MREEFLSDKALRTLVSDRVESQNFAGARQAAAKIRSEDSRQEAIKYLLVKEVGAGDVAGIKETAALVPTLGWGHWVDTLIAGLMKAGDVEGSLEIANKLVFGDEDIRFRQRYKALIVALQAENGDIAGALNTLKKVSPLGHDLDEALLGIVGAQAATGQVRDAIDTATSIKGTRSRMSALKAILQASLNPGGISGAEETAAAIEDASLREKAWEVLRNEEILSEMARRLVEVGDIIGARQIAERLTGRTFLRATWLPILVKQLELGDVRGVKEAIASLPDNSAWAGSWVHDLVVKIASTGDISGAVEICGRMSPDGPGLYLLATIVVPLQARSGDFAGARETIERLPHGEGLRDIGYCLLAEEQARKSESSGAYDSALKIEDASLRRSTMARIAETTRNQES